MLTLLSPAKKLLNFKPPFTGETTEPELLKNALELIKIMKTKTAGQIAGLMDLSTDLADLNYHRYQQFNLDANPVNQSWPALYLFQGDVYQGLSASTWRQETIDYSQSHLRILSGLYGMLKPLDRIQPYRLEMGVRLTNPAGNSLYLFWKELVTDVLNQQLALQANPVVINLASTEYAKVIDEKRLNYPMITINFYEYKNNELKMIGIYAKKARGLMAKYIMQNQVDTIEQLKDFSEEGYRFNEESSTEHHLDFIRSH